MNSNYSRTLTILIVCSGNKGKINPFIADQAAALNQLGISTDFFLIKGKGIHGYLNNRYALMKAIRSKQYDLIHAHYGLSGLLAILQRKLPVVVTFHGSDVAVRFNYLLSLLTSRLSAFNIVVIGDFVKKMRLKRKYAVVPCGVDLSVFKPIPKNLARSSMQLDPDEKIVLFSSRFNNPVKNYPLAKSAVEKLNGVRLMELANFNREETSVLMNAADVLLVTSHRETGPLVTKEALACNLPVVSTRVGDLTAMLPLIPGLYITEFDADDISDKLKLALSKQGSLDSRSQIFPYSNQLIAEKIRSVYHHVLGMNNEVNVQSFSYHMASDA